MTNSSDSDSLPENIPTNDIDQKVRENSGQIFGQMTGGIVVGQLTVYLSNIPTESNAKAETTPSSLGENPYQGLKAFRETDGDRFFGRDEQIAILLEKFHGLHVHSSTVRILPIYGPSGSGKSSLARAGLIPALGKHPLPSKDRGRVVSLTPGLRPLETLANVLARIMTNDPMAVEKSEELERVLKKKNDNQKFEGLRRIASILPDIDFSPLIILVDQFEEIYTYQAQDHQSGNDERDAFVENLLCAAGDPSQNVSVILTMRSDFLGKTQQHHQSLNTFFSSQGYLVPAMQREQLAIAITEPAKCSGYYIDRATVNLLIKDSHGLEGALPLLQFALMQIWEGLLIGVSPADTFDDLEKIGGVGGALASEAKRLYEALTTDQQQIARSAFLSMLHLHVDRNNDRRVTRRRSTISEIMRDRYSEQAVREIIECFAKPGVWILVTSSDKKGKEEIEMVEIAHEALINNWKELEGWLDLEWESILQKRRIEDAALSWKTSQGYLWEGRMLRDAKEFDQSHKDNTETFLSGDAKEFVKVSTKKERIKNLKFASIFLVFPIIGTLILVHFQILARANSILTREGCQPDPEIKTLLEYMWWTKNIDRLSDLNLCNEDLRGIKLPKAEMQKVDFKNTNLSNSDFYESVMPSSDFRGSLSAYTNFSQSFLTNSDFRCLDYRCTQLLGANFSWANLKSAKFQNSLLQDVNFIGANLTKANFEGAKNLTFVQIDNAIVCQTKLPEHIKIPSNRDCPK